MSKGEIVPDVMTTEENRSNTGAIANEGSRHLPIRSSHLKNGVRGRRTQCGKLDLGRWHVPSRKVPESTGSPSHMSQSKYQKRRLFVTHSARRCSSIPMSGQVTSNVQRRICVQHPVQLDDINRTHLRGLFSMKVISFKWAKNDCGVSATTCKTLIRV